MHFTSHVGALALLALVGCSEILELDSFVAEGGPSSASGAATSGQGGGGASSVGIGGAGVGGAGTAGEGGGVGGAGGSGPLPCDAGFSFDPESPIAGSPFKVFFTHNTGWVFVELVVTPPPQSVVNGMVTPTPPYVWDWDVVADEGTYTFDFTHKPSQTSTATVEASCTRLVLPP